MRRAMAMRWITALVERDRRVHADRVLEGLAREDFERVSFSLTISTMRRPRRGEHVAARVHRRDRRVAGHADASASTIEPSLRPCPCHAMAVRAVHAGLGLVELRERDFSGAQVLGHRPDVGARADVGAAVLAREHGPPTRR